tara:strand:+ start:90211 stop:91623 length:1413 start_codon:yes stop_codon:yes gene_type:complete
MKPLYFITFLIFLFPAKNNLKSQSNDYDKIYINIENIPKIHHKISTSKTSWRTDKSPTITYKVKNNATPYTLTFKKGYKNLTKVLDNDLVYLKLRYNPGKYQTYILRKGDSAIIEYSEGKPYIDLLNRKAKKHDFDISELLAKTQFPGGFMEFWNKNRRSRTKEEQKDRKKEFVKAYNDQLKIVDSLYQNNLLSKAEYEYNQTSIIYLKESNLERINPSLLKNKDLHINSYEICLKEYVFRRLKKQIISLGSGMARNSLEAFDYAYASREFTEENKEYLLLTYLKNIKLDFPITTYDFRNAKYKSWTKDKAIADESEDTVFDNLRIIHKKANTVKLIDTDNNSTSLASILEKNKGKVIYIDFWASWCAPCRASFPYYKDLKAAYKNKSVAFIFISTDKDAKKWKKAELKEGLTNSSLATNYPEAQFYQALNLKSIPRYLVFDKSGKLAHHSAPGPGSDEIRSLINELLSK